MGRNAAAFHGRRCPAGRTRSGAQRTGRRPPGPGLRPAADKNLLRGNDGAFPQHRKKEDDAGREPAGKEIRSMAHTLPPLPYAFDALEPYIDAKTMEIHHDKHHGGYVNNLNKALEGHPELQKLPIEELLARIGTVPEAVRTAVRNNGGGHMNHSMFWKIMKKGGGGEPSGDLAGAIQSAFGDFGNFKKTFTQAATSRFGSGWAWLLIRGGKVAVESTANQDNPIMDGG
jgi:Fe-Mn family superoxide dismutase